MHEPLEKLTKQVTETAHGWKSRPASITIDNPPMAPRPESQAGQATTQLEQLLREPIGQALRQFAVNHPELGINVGADNRITFTTVNLNEIKRVFGCDDIMIHQGIVFGFHGSFNNMSRLATEGYWGAHDAPTYLASYTSALELAAQPNQVGRVAAQPNWMDTADEINQAKVVLYIDAQALNLHTDIYLDPETLLDATTHDSLLQFKPESFIATHGIPAQAIITIKTALETGMNLDGTETITIDFD